MPHKINDIIREKKNEISTIVICELRTKERIGLHSSFAAKLVFTQSIHSSISALKCVRHIGPRP